MNTEPMEKYNEESDYAHPREQLASYFLYWIVVFGIFLSAGLSFFVISYLYELAVKLIK